MRISRFSPPRVAVLKLLVAAPFALTLAACSSTGIVPASELAHVSTVRVSLAPNLSSSARFAEMLQAKATQDAMRFGRAGAAKEVRIDVRRHSYKNPATSLLIGDANYAGAKVAVVDVASGRVQGEADASAIDSLAINGVVGAIMAAAQDKDKVDQRLAELLARDALTQVYGSPAAAEAFKRPVAPEPGKTDAAPAPAAPAATPPKSNSPKPAAPGPAPVASGQSGKTAMVGPAASAR